MKRLAAFTVALGLALASHTAPAQARAARPGNVVIDVLDVGQGDSILIRSPEGKTALIDAGPSHEVVSLLKGRGVTSIDLVAVTHHHQDHHGGMEAVIREFRPRLFLTTGSSHTTPHYLRLLTLVRDSGITAIFPTNAPRKISLGSVVLWVFPQPPEDKSEENDNSIGLRVQHGSFSALLTGDSEARERAFWEVNCSSLIRDCTVLKLAHHGSRNGTDDRWLGIVQPRLAVASLGATNEYGHPHPETLGLLARHQIPLLRTDLDGTITIRSDGKRWGVVRRQPLVRGLPPRDEQVAQAKAKHGVEHSDRLIDVNSEGLKELEALPGNGPVNARRIIEGRPYLSVDDLRRVRGIGEKRLEEIRTLVTAR